MVWSPLWPAACLPVVEEELDKVRMCDQDRPISKGGLMIEAGH